MTRSWPPLGAIKPYFSNPSLSFIGIYGAKFLFLGVQLPFFPGWLYGRGFDTASIGILLGAALIIRLMIAPFVAYRAEKFSDPRFIIRATSFVMGGAALTLLVPIPNVLVSIIAVVMLLCFGLLVPLIDTALLRADRRGALSYGPIRGIGSACFIVGSMGGGLVISVFGDQATIIWMALMALMTFVASMSLPEEPGTNVPKEPPNLRQAFKLFRSRSFLLMLFAGGLIQGAHATYYSFSEIHWSSLGYSSTFIGTLWAVGVIAEIALLVWAKPLLLRVGPAQLIALGAIGAMVRWPLTGMSPPIVFLILLQMLHALTFAATYTGTLEFIGRAVPEVYKTTAMTIVSSLGVGAMTGIASVVAGYVFDAEAPFLAYFLMGGMGGLALLLSLALIRRWDGGPLNAVPISDYVTPK